MSGSLHLSRDDRGGNGTVGGGVPILWIYLEATAAVSGLFVDNCASREQRML